jgi:predicted nucleic acid-binding protein
LIYLDTSCLLKLMLDEPESDAVRNAVAREAEVVVSALTELEAEVQLRAGWLGGQYRERQHRAYVARLKSLRDVDPFQFQSPSATLFDTALRQNRSARRVHCRTLDLLHLAVMEELGVRRLMTADAAQAAAAKALGLEVVDLRSTD